MVRQKIPINVRQLRASYKAAQEVNVYSQPSKTREMMMGSKKKSRYSAYFTSVFLINIAIFCAVRSRSDVRQ